MMIELTREHGYVFLTAIGNYMVLIWMSIKVIQARKKYKVGYPNLYSTSDDPKERKTFNCIQRAHQNTLENFGAYTLFFLLSSIKYPLVTAICGNIWSVGRIVYALGYYSGNPDGRYKGEFFYLGLFGMVGSTLYTGLQLLQFV